MNTANETPGRVAMLLDNPNGSQEIYDKVRQSLGLDRPAGGIMHIAGPNLTGGWCVVEVWESQAEAIRFLTERLAPALKAAGASGPPPQPQFWPVYHHMT